MDDEFARLVAAGKISTYDMTLGNVIRRLAGASEEEMAAIYDDLRRVFDERSKRMAASFMEGSFDEA